MYILYILSIEGISSMSFLRLQGNVCLFLVCSLGMLFRGSIAANIALTAVSGGEKERFGSNVISKLRKALQVRGSGLSRDHETQSGSSWLLKQRQIDDEEQGSERHDILDCDQDVPGEDSEVSNHRDDLSDSGWKYGGGGGGGGGKEGNIQAHSSDNPEMVSIIVQQIIDTGLDWRRCPEARPIVQQIIDNINRDPHEMINNLILNNCCIKTIIQMARCAIRAIMSVCFVVFVLLCASDFYSTSDYHRKVLPSLLLMVEVLDVVIAAALSIMRRLQPAMNRAVATSNIPIPPTNIPLHHEELEYRDHNIRKVAYEYANSRVIGRFICNLPDVVKGSYFLFIRFVIYEYANRYFMESLGMTGNFGLGAEITSWGEELTAEQNWGRRVQATSPPRRVNSCSFTFTILLHSICTTVDLGNEVQYRTPSGRPTRSQPRPGQQSDQTQTQTNDQNQTDDTNQNPTDDNRQSSASDGSRRLLSQRTRNGNAENWSSQGQ